MTRGRLPASVYWRRRLLLLAALILIVWLAIEAVSRVTGGSRDEPSAAEPLDTPAATTPAPRAKGVVSVALEKSSESCDPGNVRVTPDVPADQSAHGPIKVDLTLVAIDGSACILDPDDAELLVVISAGDAPVYDSVVCKAEFLTEPVALAAGWATQVSTEWTGRGSGKRCTAKEGFAPPGSYTIQAGTLGGEPGKSEFALAKSATAEAPEPPEARKPKKSQEPSPAPSTATQRAQAPED